MSATISSADAGTPTKLFSLEPNDIVLDVTKAGRFLILRRRAPPPLPSLGLIVNWFDHVRRATAVRSP